MPLKASELVTLLQEHIRKYGDDNVYILDGDEIVYKTFSKRHTSRLKNHFVIECESYEND